MAIDIVPPRARLSEPDVPEASLAQAGKRGRANGALWRLGAWGGSAAIALAVLALTTQTETGNRRLQLALAFESQPERPTVVVQAAPRPAESDAKTLALEAEVRALAADRDRLTARIAGLERNLDDVTGSVQRQAAAAPAPPSPPPRAEPVASLPTLLMPLAMPASTANAMPWPVGSQPQPQAETPAEVSKPPARVATATEPAAAPPRKSEAGVDLGGAPNLQVLNARWMAVKANFGPLLAGLHPLAAHDRRSGSTEFRLLAGPLPNFGAAAQLCSRFAAARVTCRPAKFDGEQIAAR